jgi:DNA-binding NarL/FixJ family response regulator
VLTAAADRLSPGYVHASFLCPYPTEGAPDGHVRITMLAGPPDSPADAAAVLLVSPPGDLRRLTPRELQILGLLVEGWPSQRIAAALFVAPRTVNAHLEHILAKLDATTRTLAAVRARRLGLYVPRPLNGVHI